MERVCTYIKAAVVVLLLAVAIIPAPVQAAGIFQGCNVDPDSEVCKAAATDTKDKAQSMTGTVINIMLFIIGAIAVIMIIIGGIRYVTSNGDSSSIQSAKNTILYAVVGLIVALLAFAIVSFVASRFA